MLLESNSNRPWQCRVGGRGSDASKSHFPLDISGYVTTELEFGSVQASFGQNCFQVVASEKQLIGHTKIDACNLANTIPHKRVGLSAIKICVAG